mgnify:CR=1 FL=1
MVTASHNPAKYNGYKAYGPDGCQMTDDAAAIVYEEIQKTDVLHDGEIGIFYYNGNAYCKKLLCNKKGTYLISLNDKYEPIEIAEGSTFKTFGRVVG